MLNDGNDGNDGTQGPDAPSTINSQPTTLNFQLPPKHAQFRMFDLQKIGRRIKALAESGLHEEARPVAMACLCVLASPHRMPADMVDEVNFATLPPGDFSVDLVNPKLNLS